MKNYHPQAASARQSRRLVLLVSGVSGILGFTGCTTRSTAPLASLESGTKVVLTEGQYEYVKVTGSNIPVLASKEALARTVPQTASPVVTMSPDAFKRMAERAASSSR